MQDLSEQNSNSSEKNRLRLLYLADWHDRATPLFLEANVLPVTFLVRVNLNARYQ